MNKFIGLLIIIMMSFALSIAQAGTSNDWKMRREHSSKIDTASFDSLPKVSI